MVYLGFPGLVWYFGFATVGGSWFDLCVRAMVFGWLGCGLGLGFGLFGLCGSVFDLPVLDFVVICSDLGMLFLCVFYVAFGCFPVFCVCGGWCGCW